eukprot:Sro327_g118480.3  (265) ;mRNA; r:66547-67341
MSSHERRLWQEYQIDDMLSVADDDDDEDSIANNIASLGRAPMQRMASRGMDSLAVGVGRDMASYFGSDDDGVLDDPKDEDDMPPLYAIVLPPLEPHEDSHATLFTCDASFQDLQPELPLLRRGATTDDSDGADQPSLPLPDLSTFMLVVDNAAGASENARASAPQSTGKLPNRTSSTDTTATAVRKNKRSSGRDDSVSRRRSSTAKSGRLSKSLSDIRSVASNPEQRRGLGKRGPRNTKNLSSSSSSNWESYALYRRQHRSHVH